MVLGGRGIFGYELRSFRELVQNPSTPWCIRHMSGSLLVADGLTKSLSSHAFLKFRKRLGVEASVVFEGAVKSMAVGRNHPVFESHNIQLSKVFSSSWRAVELGRILES